MFIYRNPDARETEKRLVPDHSPYKDDAKISLFSWSNQRFSDEEILTIILEKYDTEVLCTPPTTNVSHNVAFLANTGKLRKPNGLKCDDIINSLAKQSCYEKTLFV